MTQHSQAWREAVVKHGMSAREEYGIWNHMRQRCHNPKNDRYASYGGRGIKVCDRWRESFENFYADMGPRPPGAQLDRVDNDKGYSPENCRWATRKEQQNNTRANRIVEFNGERRTIAEWASLRGLPYARVQTRLHRGWTPERALGLQVGRERSEYCKRGHEFTPENTGSTRGHRLCKACARERGTKWMREKRLEWRSIKVVEL